MEEYSITFYVLWKCQRSPRPILAVVGISEETMTDEESMEWAKGAARIVFNRAGCTAAAIEEALSKPPRFFVREIFEDERVKETPYQDWALMHGTQKERNAAA